MSQDRVLTLAEVSAITRIPMSTLRYYRQLGAGPPFYKVGRRLYCRESDVQLWLDEHRGPADQGR